MKNIILLALIFLFNACNHGENKKREYTNTANPLVAFKLNGSSDIVDSNVKNKKINCSFTIINDTICNNILDMKTANELGIEKIFTKSFHVEKKHVSKKINEYEPTYVANLSCGNSLFLMRAFSKNNYYMGKAVIKNNCVKMFGNISIGMPKKEFSTLLDVKPIECDSVILVPTEQTSTVSFVFKNKNLDCVYINNFL